MELLKREGFVQLLIWQQIAVCCLLGGKSLNLHLNLHAGGKFFRRTVFLSDMLNVPSIIW